MLKSITFRVAAVFTLVMLFMAILASGTFLYLYSSYAVSDKQNTLTFCAQDIARLISEQEASVTEYQPSTDLSAYTSFVESVVRANVWVMYDTGIFKRDNVSGTSPLHVKELSDGQSVEIFKALNGQTITTDAFSDYFGQETLSVIYPIDKFAYSDSEGNEIIGVVIIHCTNAEMSSAYETTEKFLIMSIVISVVLAAMVSVFISLKLTKPIRQMRDVAVKLTEGDYSVRSDTLSGFGEVGDLAKAFNHLAETLEDKITELTVEKGKVDIMLQNISDGIALFDGQLKPLKRNAVLMTMCVYHFYEDPQIHDIMQKTLETGQPCSVTVEGDEILKYTASPVRDGDETTGVIVTIKDISYTERLERTRREFVSNVSHEFRTPLTIIKGSVELLVDGAVTEPEEVLKTYLRIENETKALERLVYDLLDVSRFKSGRMQLKMERLNICSLAESVVSGVGVIADKKGIELVYNGEKNLEILGDPARMRQVMIIFLDNAMKFTAAGGKIVLSVLKKDDMVQISIADSGSGIAKEDIPFIFERFYKVDKARGGSSSGSGLGLSIASSIIEYHGGTIDVESDLGKGTTFTIIVPCYNAAASDDSD